MLFVLRKTLSVTLLLLGFFFSQQVRAQGGDTLTLAHKLTDAKDFGQATSLLARYEKNHPTNTDAVRLHLQLLYWTNRLPEAAKLYGRAHRQQPAATNLQLDYGRILYETKQYPKAKEVLVPLLQKEPANVEALTMLGIINYNENNFTQAAGYLNKVLASYPDNPTANVFAQKITALKAARAPYLHVYNTYRADDQPLKWVENKLEVGRYHSALLSPSLQAVLWSTRDSSSGFRQHFEALVGNKSTFLNQKLTAQLQAGIFKHAAQRGAAFVGSATLRYQLPKGFALEAAGSRAPYFFTIASGRAAVLYSQVYGALLFQPAKGWQGRLQATENYFPGGNRLVGLSVWALSRALTLGPVYVKGGYSFGYNDAQYNTYAPVLSTTQIAASNRPVAGTYGAYFTPSQQLIHSLLLNADAKAGSRCWVSLKGSVGVFAQAQNPYLFLNSDRAGLFIDKGFYTERYSPFEVKGQVSYSPSDHLGLEGGYVHTKAFFYTADQVFANLKYAF
ncbi:MAG: tetratricopeptide repeat protein [Hymenobacter sp.]|nr:MAG: tetratricopeptide repeat protein [Hymenobacter sp.]